MYILYFDGCSKGNPGKGGCGAVLYCEEKEVWSDCLYLGESVTNNVAEYNGIIMGLEHAAKLGVKRLLVKGDSQLVIHQITGKYAVRTPHLSVLHKKAKELEAFFESVEYMYVPRKHNERADFLSNQALNNI